MRGALDSVMRLVRTDHGVIARDMSTIFLFILLAKAAAAAKEMAVAWRFGTGPTVDAYLFVFNIVSIPIVVWYAVMSVVFIPLSARIASVAPDDERRFRAELFGASLLLGVLLAILLWALLHLALRLTGFGLNDETHALAIASVNWLVLTIPVGLAVNYGSVLLMARGRHVNSLLEGAPALALLLILLLWNGGLLALLLGTLAGWALHLLLTGGALAWGRGLPRPRFAFSAQAWRDFRAGVGMMLVAQLLLALTAVVDQLFAASLASGSISALGYATRVLSLFLALGATTIGRAMLPVFARVRQSDEQGLHSLARHWTAGTFLAGLAVLLVGWTTSEWLVRLLFERGAFSASDTQTVAEVLRWGLLQIPFYFAVMAASQAIFSFGRYRIAATIAAVSLAVKVLFSFLLVPALGLVGLMVATAAMHGVTFMLILYALHRMRAQARSAR